MGITVRNLKNGALTFPVDRRVNITLQANGKVGCTKYIADEHKDHPNILRLAQKGVLEIVSASAAAEIEEKAIDPMPSTNALEFERAVDKTKDVGTISVEEPKKEESNAGIVVPEVGQDVQMPALSTEEEDTTVGSVISTEDGISTGTPSEATESAVSPVEVEDAPVEVEEVKTAAEDESEVSDEVLQFSCCAKTASGNPCKNSVKMTQAEFDAAEGLVFCGTHAGEDKDSYVNTDGEWVKKD